MSATLDRKHDATPHAQPHEALPPVARAPISSAPSGGFTSGTPGASYGMTGGISARDPKGPDAKIKLSGGIG